MRLYRICPERLLENYSGLGASFQDGGRWNRPGLPALYFAASPGVAMLEMANYLRSPRLVPEDYRLGVYETTTDIQTDRLPVRDLPADWREYPYPPATQALGSRWLIRAETALLIIPSAAIPGGLENIVLANPAHPDSKTLKLVSAETDIYSLRAFSSEVETVSLETALMRVLSREK